MRFISEWGFSIKVGKTLAFQEWVAENEERLARSYPEGTSLLGIYAAVFTSEKQAGDFFALERIDSYSALDRMAALAKDAETEFGKLNDELTEFLNFDPGAPWSRILLKAVSDATIFDSKP